MAIDVTTEPGRTLQRLASKLMSKQTRLAHLTHWMDGHGPLPEFNEAYKAAYKMLQERARLNFAPIVVQAVKERMAPVGFLVGESAESDTWAWQCWTENEMRRQSSEVHGDMLGLFTGYAIVGEPDESGFPVITREDPRQCITEHDPLRRSRVTAALKMYTDTRVGRDYAYLYLPGVILVASRASMSSATLLDESVYRPGTLASQSASGIESYDWDVSFGDAGVFQLSVPDVVPVVPFENAGIIAGFPMAEFEGHTDTLERIQLTLLHRLVITYVQAFRQRAIMGELPEMDEDGNHVDYSEVFKPGAGNIWTTNAPAEGENSIKFWESQNTDVTPLLSAVKDDLKTFAAETATPLSMLMPDSTNQSAEGAAASKEALISKVRDRQALAGYGWNNVMRLAFMFAGKGRQNVETQWLPPDLVSLSEKADAYSKLADLPMATKLRECLQLPPDQIARIEKEKLEDVLASSLAPAPTAVNGAQ